MNGCSRRPTETHAMSGVDLLWAWIRAQDGQPFTIDDAFSASALTRATISRHVTNFTRVGILQRADTVQVKWTKRPRNRYRLAVDYGPDTPVIDREGTLRERVHNFDTPRAVWATFRIHECLSWNELLANLNSGRLVTYKPRSVKDYMRRVLVPGGYVVNQGSRRPAQYLLVENTGPRAPAWKGGGIWDANLGKHIEPVRKGVAHA